MTKSKTIIVFCLVFVSGFMVGKNLDRTIEAYKSYKRWSIIVNQLQSYQDTPFDEIKKSLHK